jgi:heme exporter protein B
MNLIKQTYLLLQHDFSIELRKKSTLFSIFLYVFSSSYFIYFLMNTQGALVHLEVKIWNILFWILLLFSTIQNIYKSTVGLTSARYLYYYTMFRPEAYILAKMIFQTIYTLLISIVSFIIFALLFGNPVVHYGLFFLSISLGSISFSIIYTLVINIAYHTSQSAILSSILGFPLTIPLVTFISRICKEAFFHQLSDHFVYNFLILMGFNVILIFLSVILYPYIWRD